jgi:hypothetical protein
MIRFLIVSFQSGTYGNFISQQFLKLAPDQFSVKNWYPKKLFITQNNNRYYHNMQPWLGNTFYFYWAPCRHLEHHTVEEIADLVQKDTDYPNLDKQKYNIVFTHEHNLNYLEKLKQALPNSKILKITYNNSDVKWISERFVDIFKDIDCKTNVAPVITIEEHQKHLLSADLNCNGCIEFPVNQRENTEFITKLIKNYF